MDKIDVVILAGGLGTRLRSVIKEIPKPMAPVNGKPFLAYLLRHLDVSIIRKFVFSVGYKYQVIENYFGNSFLGIPIEYCIENEPLGTGGGIKKALDFVQTKHCAIINGDTFLDEDLSEGLQYHLNTQSEFTICLKKMDHPYRYGTVLLKKNKIVQFLEKDASLTQGIINAGIYFAQTSVIKNNLPNEEKFSFETDFLECQIQHHSFFGYVTDADFVDIGIPEDYKLFQNIQIAKKQNILLLDRDGVINVYHHYDYVKKVEEFNLINGVLASLKIVRDFYDFIYIITNQQGIGRQLMAETDIENVHLKFYEMVKNAQSFFPTIFYAPYLKTENHHWRKPKTGMVDYLTDILKVSTNQLVFNVCGDAPTDMELGDNIQGLKIRIQNPYQKCENFDQTFDSLQSFAQYLMLKLQS